MHWSELRLETKRLILRPPTTDDFQGWCDFHGDPKAMEFLAGIQAPSVVWRTMRGCVGSWALDGFSFFSVIEKSSNKWIGRVGPIYPFGWPGLEIAWGLSSNYWGYGYAREAATAAINFAFDELGWDRILHLIHPENVRSQSVAHALGSHKDGPGKMPDPFAHLPVEIWSQTKADWLARSLGRFDG